MLSVNTTRVQNCYCCLVLKYFSLIFRTLSEIVFFVGNDELVSRTVEPHQARKMSLSLCQMFSVIDPDAETISLESLCCFPSLASFGRPWWLSCMRHPTGDQEVGGSTPAEVGNILSRRLIVKYFLRSFCPFR